MSRFTFEQKQNVLANLIRLSQQGTPSPAKLLFIQTVALKMEVTREEMDRIISGLHQTNGQTAAFNEEEKVEQFYMLLSLLSLNGNASSNELSFCREAGINLGLTEAKVQEMLDFMHLMNSTRKSTTRAEFVQLFA